jgi:hypothetical protein
MRLPQPENQTISSPVTHMKIFMGIICFFLVFLPSLALLWVSGGWSFKFLLLLGNLFSFYMIYMISFRYADEVVVTKDIITVRRGKKYATIKLEDIVSTRISDWMDTMDTIVLSLSTHTVFGTKIVFSASHGYRTAWPETFVTQRIWHMAGRKSG